MMYVFGPFSELTGQDHRRWIVITETWSRDGKRLTTSETFFDSRQEALGAMALVDKCVADTHA